MRPIVVPLLPLMLASAMQVEAVVKVKKCPDGKLRRRHAGAGARRRGRVPLRRDRAQGQGDSDREHLRGDPREDSPWTPEHQGAGALAPAYPLELNDGAPVDKVVDCGTVPVLDAVEQLCQLLGCYHLCTFNPSTSLLTVALGPPQIFPLLPATPDYDDERAVLSRCAIDPPA